MHVTWEAQPPRVEPRHQTLFIISFPKLRPQRNILQLSLAKAWGTVCWLQAGLQGIFPGPSTLHDCQLEKGVRMEGVLVVGTGLGQNFLAFPETVPLTPLSPEEGLSFGLVS